MKSYQEAKEEFCPSSAYPKLEEKEKFILPEDEEAEKLIYIEGVRTEELIDVAFQGIDLKTYDGTPFTRTSLAVAINSAIETAEQTFDITIKPRIIEKELHDYEGGSFQNYQYTATFRRPIMEVYDIKYLFGDQTIYEVPKNWIQVDHRMGDITILPVSGRMNMMPVQLGTVFPTLINRSFVPMAISVSYKAGMKKEDVPMNLMMYIFKMAAIDIFNQWGDQIIGAGIASSSLSIDGLSQSIGTTQSAMYGGASARILEYRNDIESLTPIIRKYFAKLNVVVL